jgi:aquaporin Z
MKNNTFDPLSMSGLAVSEKEIAALGQHWGWILATGIVYVLLGFWAISLPVASTVGLTIGLAAVLIVGGIVRLVQAIRLRHRHGMALRFFQSALAIVVGGLMLRYPSGGMMFIALSLSFYFFTSAVTQWIFFSAAKPYQGRWWGIASSIVSFILGVFIILTFPFSALWVPGTFLGIDLIFAGAGMMGFSFVGRKLHRNLGAETPDIQEKSTMNPSPQPT